MYDEYDSAEDDVCDCEERVEREALVVLCDGPEHEGGEGQAQAEEQGVEHVVRGLQGHVVSI